MKTCKNIFNRIFVEAMSGMTLGLFATLIVGTIIQQIGGFVDNEIGSLLETVGKLAAMLTGAGIGVGVAYKFKQSPLVILSCATAGMIGSFSSQILTGSAVTGAGILLRGPGEPLGAFLAAYIAMEVGQLIAGKTKVDILVTPLATIVSGALVGLLAGPPITTVMLWLGEVINWATQRQPLILGIVVSVLMGMVLTLPISSAALGIILNLSGMAAGAATIGCCCNMVGFAVASYRENKVPGLIAQGIGTSMLQVPNIAKRPMIWLPAIVSSAILGPIGIMGFGMVNNATGSGMGTAGLVGQIMTFKTMVPAEDAVIVMIKIITFHIILPAILTLLGSEFMRKKGWIKFGDMKLELQ